ncbi:MAG: hypothetical protein WCK98_05770 [bacterium]
MATEDKIKLCARRVETPRVDLRQPENSVGSWQEFTQRYGESIQGSQIQLENPSTETPKNLIK